MTSKRSIERRLENLEPEGDLPSLSLATLLSSEEEELVQNDPPVVKCDGQLYQDSHGTLRTLIEVLDDDDEEREGVE